MKRLLNLAFILIFLFSAIFPFNAFAEGDSNIDNGGGGMGSGSASSYWNGGEDGVRVTVVTAGGQQVTTPIDLTNINANNVDYSFGKVSKFTYVSGSGLTLQAGGYGSFVPGYTMPRIISSSAVKASLAQIKSYFTDQLIVQYIADMTGVDYNTLIGGKYKLLIEPIAYFHFQGYFFAMTATEAALYNEACGGALRSSMVSLTSKNLPLAMYLDVADVGFPAYSGSTTTAQTDDTIIWQLGLGVVSFTNQVTPDPQTADYTYRTDTDVISSISITNNGSRDITPDESCSVDFQVLGTTYKKSFICPSGQTQLVWVKWHTPAAPQTVTIHVTGEGISVTATIMANIVKIQENPPPDPQYADTNSGFKLSDTPDYGNCTSLSWSQWSATWTPPADSKSVGYWNFEDKTYTAILDICFLISPDTRVKTAKLQTNKKWEMKSGYGIDADSNTSVYTSGSPSFSTDYTQAQTEITTFSDFKFDTYTRFLEPEDSASSSTDWHFKANNNSYYGCRVHFTPLWYPDNTKYIVSLWAADAWTPAGMLYTTTSDYILINGSVYDDWYIRLK